MTFRSRTSLTSTNNECPNESDSNITAQRQWRHASGARPAHTNTNQSHITLLRQLQLRRKQHNPSKTRRSSRPQQPCRSTNLIDSCLTETNTRRKRDFFWRACLRASLHSISKGLWPFMKLLQPTLLYRGACYDIVVRSYSKPLAQDKSVKHHQRELSGHDQHGTRQYYFT